MVGRLPAKQRVVQRTAIRKAIASSSIGMSASAPSSRTAAGDRDVDDATPSSRRAVELGETSIEIPGSVMSGNLRRWCAVKELFQV
jgi:hypothetical protein